MPFPPIQFDAAGLDLSPRVKTTTDITGSPAAGTEAIVSTLAALPNVAPISGVLLIGFVAFTVGTNGVSVNYKIRRTNASGTTIVATGVTNEGVTAATELGTRFALGFDPGPTLPGQVYVATLTVGSGSAASTVSAAQLTAIIV